MTTPAIEITGLVLAGGQGRRMGGVDKGLVELAGRPMIAHVLERLAPQVGAILVNANQNADRYAAFGYPVLPDLVQGFAGPLAGLHAGLASARARWLATVPCDSPFLPADLVQRLATALRDAGADVAVARTFDQPHPVFSLVDVKVRPHLDAFLTGGGRKIDAWYASLRVVEVGFDDCAAAFRNVNTPAELHEAGASAVARDAP
jgi:molybdopterin-guanine dinucleotide biosynthesis protein A